MMAGTALGLVLAQSSALAQSAGDITQIPTTVVIGVSPVLGVGIDQDKLPANTRSLSAKDLENGSGPTLPNALFNRIGAVNIDENQGNPFQPDVVYRGFTASPVSGTPQGLAVYMNGVRINEAYGDVVNWDLIPNMAINRLNLVSSNPVYGLNAIGGALSLEMKNGFTYQGFEAELQGGSFGRRETSMQYGIKSGVYGAYLAGTVFDEDGWRDQSKSQVRQLYGDIGVQTEKAEIHLSFNGATNRLSGVGPTPVEMLSVKRESVFTYPQTYRNDVVFTTLAATFALSDNWSLQNNLYIRDYRQTVVNGNTTEIEDAGGGLLQDENGNPVQDLAGNQITFPSGLNGYGSLDRDGTHTLGIGGSVQASYTGEVFDRSNLLVFGGSFDHGDTDFTASSELGLIDFNMNVIGSQQQYQIVDAATGLLIQGPIRLKTRNNYYGLYATDTLDVTDKLAATASGRFNVADIRLRDQLAGPKALNGDTSYTRFNPAGGVTYKLTDTMTTYAGYSEANRAPTPGEIACSDPNRPCTLQNFLVADPPNLKQVVSHTYEAGLRGSFALASLPGKGSWNVGYFRTDLDDDILNVPSATAGRGYFKNIGNTRRQGAEAGASYTTKTWSVFADYSYVRATFEDRFQLQALDPNYAAAVGGNFTVTPGKRIPGVPEHRLKLGADYAVTSNWSVGGTLTFLSDQILRGDEANIDSALPSYKVVNLHTTYVVTKNFEIFGLIQNLTNEKFSTFGILGDPTNGGALALPGVAAGTVSNRLETPGAPLSGFGGIRVRF